MTIYFTSVLSFHVFKLLISILSLMKKKLGRTTFSISYRADLMVMESFRFCFLRKSGSFLHFWKTALLGTVFLFGRVFVFVCLFPQHTEYIIWPSLGWQGFCWEICWWTYVGPYMWQIYLSFFFNCLFDLRLFYYNVSWRKSFWIEISGRPVSLMNLGVQVSLQIEKFSASIPFNELSVISPSFLLRLQQCVDRFSQWCPTVLGGFVDSSSFFFLGLLWLKDFIWPIS